MESVKHVGLPHADLDLHVAGPGRLVHALRLPHRLHLGVVAGKVDGLGVGGAADEAPGRVLGGECVLRLLEEHGEGELGGVALRQRVGEEAAGQVQAEDKTRG